MTTTFSEAVSRARMTAFQWMTVIVCMFVLVCDGMDLQLLGIVAPLVMQDFGVDRGTFGIAMSAALIGFGLGAWGGGKLGDSIGRRWTLAIAALVFSLATVGAGSAEGVWSMAAWRIVGGLGFGAGYANALALASEWLPDRWRPVAVSTLSVGTPIGGTVVGWVGPDMAAAYGWDGTFVRIGLATLIMVVLIIALLRESPSFLLAHGRRDAAQRNAKLVLRDNVELEAERETEEGGGPKIGVLHPMNLRLNIGIGIAFAAAALVAYGILSWSTTFLTAAGFTLDAAGNAVSIAGITSMVGSVIVGMVMRRLGSKHVMALLSVVLIVLMIVLAWAVESLPAQPSAEDQLFVTVLIGAAGFVFSSAIAGMYVMMALGYPQSCRSAGIGFGIFMSRVGAISATGLGGALLEMGGDSTIPFFTVLTVAAALVACAAFVVDRHVPSLAEAERRRLATAT